MAELIRVKTFNPKVLKVAEVRGKILSAMQKEGKYQESLFRQTYATWDEPPSVDSTISYRGGTAELYTSIQGSDKSVLKWIMLNEGFDRYARLSHNWKSKTTPGTLKSGRGQGKVVGFSQQIIAPVAARRWLSIIRKRTRGRFNKAIKRAIKEGLDLAQSRGKVI